MLQRHELHSAVEVVSLRGLEMLPELLASLALTLRQGEEFKVKI